MSGKSGKSVKVRRNKKDESQENSGKMGIFEKSQEILYKHALNKKVYHH